MILHDSSLDFVANCGITGSSDSIARAGLTKCVGCRIRDGNTFPPASFLINARQASSIDLSIPNARNKILDHASSHDAGSGTVAYIPVAQKAGARPVQLLSSPIPSPAVSLLERNRERCRVSLR